MCVAFFKSVSIQTCKTVQERDANNKRNNSTFEIYFQINLQLIR